MIIKCIKCKKEFEQSDGEYARTCMKHRTKMDCSQYMINEKRLFQNPKYQWYKEFISNEKVSSIYESNSKIFEDWI